MPVNTQIEQIPLSKHRLLEFLEGQTEAVTAKIASIDLDSRASTVTEMLERCAAQGLAERDANERPRLYTITEAGRRSLELFSPSEDESAHESADSERNTVLRSGSKKLKALLERARTLEGSHELSAEQAKAEAHSGVIRSLYRAKYELRSLGLFDSKTEVRARIAELESAAGKEVAKQLERLVSMEGEIRGDSNPETLRAVLELRDALHLPASVFGRERRAWSSAEEFAFRLVRPCRLRAVNALPLSARFFARGEGGGRGASSPQASELLHLSVFKINCNGRKS
jgi:hypothetical protein